MRRWRRALARAPYPARVAGPPRSRGGLPGLGQLVIHWAAYPEFRSSRASEGPLVAAAELGRRPARMPPVRFGYKTGTTCTLAVSPGQVVENVWRLDRGLPARLHLTRGRRRRDRQHDVGSDLDAGPTPIAVPELLRLLRDTVIPPPRRDRPAGCSGQAGDATSTACQAHRRWIADAETTE
jgi:hypothetical protein